MTEDETDAGVGRLARKLTEVKRKLACAKDRLKEFEPAATGLSACFNVRQAPDYEKLQALCRETDWRSLVETANALVTLTEEKTRLEECLREAGVDLR